MVAFIRAERKCSESDAKNSGKYRKLEDNCKCIQNICMYHINDVRQLKTYITKIFSDEKIKNAITLSTVHKAKGLESDRVMILLPTKLPLVWRNQQDWQLQQEQNLKYVAITRAKKELVIVDMTEQQLDNVKIG